jgi:hypothetical protein
VPTMATSCSGCWRSRQLRSSSSTNSARGWASSPARASQA